MASNQPELRHGRRLGDGTVRYVAQSLHPLLTVLLLATVVGTVVVVMVWPVVPMWLPLVTAPVLVLPFMRTGFDVRTQDSDIEVWHAVGPWRRKRQRVGFRAPSVKDTTVDTRDADGTPTTSFVTVLEWGRVRIPTRWDDATPRGGGGGPSVDAGARATAGRLTQPQKRWPGHTMTLKVSWDSVPEVKVASMRPLTPTGDTSSMRTLPAVEPSPKKPHRHAEPCRFPPGVSSYVVPGTSGSTQRSRK